MSNPGICWSIKSETWSEKQLIPCCCSSQELTLLFFFLYDKNGLALSLGMAPWKEFRIQTSRWTWTEFSECQKIEARGSLSWNVRFLYFMQGGLQIGDENPLRLSQQDPRRTVENCSRICSRVLTGFHCSISESRISSMAVVQGWHLSVKYFNISSHPPN